MSGIEETNSTEDDSGSDAKAPVKRRPRRARRNVAELASTILARDVRKISLMVTKAALDGDMAAAKLVLGLLIPVPKSRTVKFELGPISSASDGEHALGGVLAAVAGGQLTPNEGGKIADIIRHKAETGHMAEVERRLEALESQKTITSYRRIE
jgi:hypothetical protein